MDDKIYYIYKYTLGEKKVEVSELDIYEGEDLDEVKLFTYTNGKSVFVMYSESNEAKNEFLKQVSNALRRDAEAARRLADLAYGRLWAFQEERKKLTEEEKNYDR